VAARACKRAVGKSSRWHGRRQILDGMRILPLFVGSVLFCLTPLQAAEPIVSREAKIGDVQLHYLTAESARRR
jgi:hypothetical protein